MRADATVWMLFAALGFSGCGGHEKQDGTPRTTRQDPPLDDAPYRGSTGYAGQLGRGSAGYTSAGSGSSAGNIGNAGAAGGGGTGGMGAGGAANGGSMSASVAGSNSDAGSPDCPTPKLARLANGQCVDRVTEFSVGSNPTSIVTGSDGKIWFDDGSGNQIVRLDDRGQVLNRIDLGSAATSHDLVAGVGDTAVWFIDNKANTLTSLSRTVQRSNFPLGFKPEGFTLGERGQFWLTEWNKAIRRFVPGESYVPNWQAAPNRDIVVGPDGNLWFPEGQQIGRLTLDGKKESFSISNSFADFLCAGSDGALWYTDGTLSQIGRVEADGTFSRTFDLPPSSGPWRIIAGPDGALWFAEKTTEMIGRIDVNGSITHYPIPTSGSLPTALTVGPDHNIWFAETFSGKIGRLIPDPVQ